MLRTICSIYRFASIQAIYRGMDFCPYRPALVLYGAVAWSHVLWWNSWRWRNSLEDRKSVYVHIVVVCETVTTHAPTPFSLSKPHPNFWALIFRTRLNTWLSHRENCLYLQELFWPPVCVELFAPLFVWNSLAPLFVWNSLPPLFEWNSADLQQSSPWRSDSRPDWRMAHP